MLNKLTDAEKRYLEIEQKLSEPDIFSDTEKYTALMKEYKALTPIIEKFREYKATDKEAADLKAMLEEPVFASVMPMTACICEVIAGLYELDESVDSRSLDFREEREDFVLCLIWSIYHSIEMFVFELFHSIIRPLGKKCFKFCVKNTQKLKKLQNA